MKLLEFGSIKVALAPIAPSASPRDAERMAARRLLAELLGVESVEICHDKDGAPFVEGGDFCLSISHSRNIIAVAVSPEKIGIDIEQARPEQISRVAARVLSAVELDYYSHSDEALLQAWTLKEALYKAADNADADFRRDIVLPVCQGEKKASVATIDGEPESFNIVFSEAVEVGDFKAWLSVVLGD